jgi:spore germination cell wall hydrolase CwlJ-like protein
MPRNANHNSTSPIWAASLLCLALGGCQSALFKQAEPSSALPTSAQLQAPAPKETRKPITLVSSSAHECLARAMYFESNRNSDDGMLAVGTVVMNRVQSSKYPDTICGVVGQKGQFASGVLTKPTPDLGYSRAKTVAFEVLARARHKAVGRSMYFHTAGFRIPYKDAEYLVVAGGNAFYTRGSTTEESMPTFKTLKLASLQFSSFQFLQ